LRSNGKHEKYFLMIVRQSSSTASNVWDAKSEDASGTASDILSGHLRLIDDHLINADVQEAASMAGGYQITLPFPFDTDALETPI
jgi:hypothetical protein